VCSSDLFHMMFTLPYAFLTLLLNPFVSASVAVHNRADAAAERTELAKALSQPEDQGRQKAVDSIVASPRTALPWLLEWSHCNRNHGRWLCANPPPEAGVLSNNL